MERPRRDLRASTSAVIASYVRWYGRAAWRNRWAMLGGAALMAGILLIGALPALL